MGAGFRRLIQDPSGMGAGFRRLIQDPSGMGAGFRRLHGCAAWVRWYVQRPSTHT